ncbi:tetratricopeptide (TPR) repeat protein [Catenulispora sp. EB89]|uniref:CHAT domain-containing protein n=1 Tax=Catenulispora sp. EB89 TaxID=3156257 RepID=UPI0035119BA3
MTDALRARPSALVEAGRLHRLGVEAAALGRPAVAARHLRKALRLLGVPLGARPVAAWESAPSPDRDVVAARILTSLAHAEAEQGRTSLGFALLVRCEPLVASADRGKFFGQRGLLLLRTGRARAALADFDLAVGLIDAEREPVEMARVLLNRTVARMETGAFAGARSDSERCLELARAADRPLLAVKALHNLGCCDLIVGDVPAALRTIGEAADGFAVLSPSWRPVAVVDIARALLLAGLATDAAAELDTAIGLFRGQRMSQDRAEAEAVRAEASLLAGDARAAREWARSARAGFRRRGNASGAAAAELIALQAAYQLTVFSGTSVAGGGSVAGDVAGVASAAFAESVTSRSPARLAARAFDLAGRLRELGLGHDATAAELLGIRALVAADRVAEAARRARTLRTPGRAVPLDVRMLRYLTLAELSSAAGERETALRTLRSGLAVLSRHRSRLGSVDLQTGTAALGVEVAAAGLALSLVDGKAAEVFTWSELSRAQALRIKPVRPATDPEVAAAVAELRQLEFGRRTAVMAGTPADPAFNGRRTALERRIRQSAWPSPGAGSSGKVAGLDETAAALAPSRQALISLFRQGGTLFGLVVTDTERRVLPLGGAAETYETARRLRADITALVGRLLPSRMEKAVTEALTAHATQLDARLFGPTMLGLIGDRELVVVPCGPLAALPWQLLPALRGRPLTVAPSATSWLAAHRARAVSAPAASNTATRHADDAAAATARNHLALTLIAGPGLREATRELNAIASQYPDSTTLDGAHATVQATLRALDGAPMAHLAVHGRHEPDNVLFSRLELADGPLMAYDLLHLDAAPRHVVLSACDVGHVSMRPGEEPLGLVTTLLHLGSSTVVAASAPVGDAATAEVMAAYHRHLLAGSTPSQALAAATGPNPMAAFTCFGAG